MNTVKFFTVIGLLLIFAGAGMALRAETGDPFVAAQAQTTPTPVTKSPLPETLSGVVVNADGVVANAIVQLQGSPATTRTAEDGSFTMTNVEGMMPVNLVAWAEGHYNGWTLLDPTAADWQDGSNITISLRTLPVGDNSKYEWFTAEEVEGSPACGLCHREYVEWQKDQHAQAATNPRYLTMYTGTNVNGDEGQYTEFDAEGHPKPLDPNLPHYGAGFLLDNAGRVGNCATCHTPLASNSPNTQNCSWLGCHMSITIERSNGFITQQARMPQYLTGDAAEGISCEFCHKIRAVTLNAETQLPLPDMPGILSYTLSRPAEDSQQVFYGTLVDVTAKDAYLPLLSESQFCAGCHYGVFGGVVGMGEVAKGTLVYNSYGEWLDSPYSDPENGVTCQQCHMPKSDANWIVTPDRGGVVRDYADLNDHTMLGAYSEDLLKNSVTLNANAEREGDQLQVEVSITNDKTGHHVPTDAPIRSMILVVEAFDADGNRLALREGSVNPEYSGEYGGQPGKTFAKVLRDEWTGEAPTGAYWRTVTILEDTRLAAMATDTTEYRFDAPAGTEITIEVRLLFRRAFTELAAQKGWDDADILMEQETIHLSTN